MLHAELQCSCHTEAAKRAQGGAGPGARWASIHLRGVKVGHHVGDWVPYEQKGCAHSFTQVTFFLLDQGPVSPKTFQRPRIGRLRPKIQAWTEGLPSRWPFFPGHLRSPDVGPENARSVWLTLASRMTHRNIKKPLLVQAASLGQTWLVSAGPGENYVLSRRGPLDVRIQDRETGAIAP